MADNKDGYYYRNKEGESVGPISKPRFERLRSSGAISAGTKAWRIAGGSAYKVQLKETLVWDASHVYSCKSCSHMFELCSISITSLMTMSVFWIVDWEKERKKSGSSSSTIWILRCMGIICIVMVVFTIRKVASRWRKVSCETFVSEV
jgi:hypothetical protein